MATDNNGSFYLSGHFYGLVDFDLGVGFHNNFHPSQGLFLAKYSFNAVGIDESEFDSNFPLYPNPASNKINIEFEKEEQLVNLQIVNVQGQNVFSKEYQNTKNIHLNIEGFTSGFYFAKIITGGEQKSIKFIKK